MPSVVCNRKCIYSKPVYPENVFVHNLCVSEVVFISFKTGECLNFEREKQRRHVNCDFERRRKNL